MSERLLKLTEISDRTTVPLATLQWWRAMTPDRGPHTFKIGGRVVAKESDVDAWIEAQYAASEPAA